MFNAMSTERSAPPLLLFAGTQDPFLGGIKYNAMPPLKRFRDMDQLSGGEKTVAALAFLFALHRCALPRRHVVVMHPAPSHCVDTCLRLCRARAHSFKPAPFFVMDEVDAALDNMNVEKICNYIKHRSKSDFQCIVISLKDMFYQQADSLAGICRDVKTNSSRTLMLDLREYD